LHGGKTTFNTKNIIICQEGKKKEMKKKMKKMVKVL